MPADARVSYRFHPRFGEVVQIMRRLETGGVEFVVVLQPDGSFASLPAWMTEPEASRFTIGDEPKGADATLGAFMVGALAKLPVAALTEAAAATPHIAAYAYRMSKRFLAS
jgi:hypothetical protein